MSGSWGADKWQVVLTVAKPRTLGMDVSDIDCNCLVDEQNTACFWRLTILGPGGGPSVSLHGKHH